MDSHNVGRGRPSISQALSSISAKATVIGIDTDVLFPLLEQEYLASKIEDAKFYSISSIYGHDGFLIEKDKINDILIKVTEQIK